MRQLLKRLFACLFLGKKNEEKSQVPSPKPQVQREHPEEVRSTGEQPKPSAPSQPKEQIRKIRDSFMEPTRERKWRMKNNRLHIMYNGTGVLGANFTCNRDKITNRILSFEKQEKRYNGTIESMRCTKLERARNIVGGISRDIIKTAIFQDKKGEQFKLI